LLIERGAAVRSFGWRSATVSVLVAGSLVVAGTAGGQTSDKSDRGGGSQDALLSQQVGHALDGWAKDAEPVRAPKRSSRAQIEASHLEGRARRSPSRVRGILAERAPSMVTSHAVVPDEERLGDALGPRAIQSVDGRGRVNGVVSSSVPIAVKDDGAKRGATGWIPADLGLVQKGERFAPRRSLVAVSMPATAGGLVRAGQLGARFAPAESASQGTVSGEAVIYPEALPGTDLVHRGTGAGSRTAWVINHPDGPQQLSIDLDLPQGTKAVLEHESAVRIVNGADEDLGSISPAVAVDADGISVPLTTTVRGDRVVYELQEGLGNLKTPVVVDPQLSVNWVSGSSSLDGWAYSERPLTNPRFFETTVFGHPTPAYNGLYVTGAQTSGYVAGDYGGWTRFAPGDPAHGTVSPVSGRYTSPDHSFIWQAEIGGLDYTSGNPWGPDPNVNAGIQSTTDTIHPANKYQIHLGTGYSNPPVNGNLKQLFSGTAGGKYKIFSGSAPDTKPTTEAAIKPSNAFSVALYDFNVYGASSNPRPASQMHVGWVNVWADDNTAPKFPDPPNDPGWTDETTATIAVSRVKESAQLGAFELGC